jgi:hypothetical protein
MTVQWMENSYRVVASTETCNCFRVYISYFLNHKMEMWKRNTLFMSEAQIHHLVSKIAVHYSQNPRDFHHYHHNHNHYYYSIFTFFRLHSCFMFHSLISHKYVTLRRCPSKISDATCDHTSSCFKKQ